MVSWLYTVSNRATLDLRQVLHSKIDYCLPPSDCIGLGMLLLKTGGGVRVGSTKRDSFLFAVDLKI